MGNRQTKAAKPQTEVTQTARKFEPEPEPSTVKTEVPVAIPETPPQPSEPPFEPPPDDTSPTKDTTQDPPPPPPPVEDPPPVEHTEIKQQKEYEKELLEPLPVLLTESESVEEKLRQSEEVVHVMESEHEQNELVSVTAPVTDQEIITEDPIPITSDPTTTEISKETTSEDITKNETTEIKENEIESKIEDKSPEAVLLESESAVCKEEEEMKEEEVKNEEEEEDEEEIADSKTPSIAMETASVSSSAIKMDVEYMKGIMGTSLTFPDATSNESVIGSLAVSEQTLDESFWDNSGPSKTSIKCPIPSKDDSMVSIDFQMIDQTVKVGLTSLEPVQKEDQKKQEVIPEELEIPEVKELQSKSILDPLHEEIPPPEQSQSTSNLEKFESFVSVEFREENEEIKVGMNCVSKAQIASSTSMVSDKQMSVELKTPFVDVDEEETNLKESKSADAFSDSKSSEKTKAKKPKKSTSMKSTGSGVDGELESTNAQVKRANSGQSKIPKSSS